jgi:phage terminase Nu1 subunit (DNA packaging protein)
LADVGVQKVAYALNVTVRRVQQLANEGMPHGAKRGQYDLAACMVWYIRYLQKALERRDGSGDQAGASLRIERQRLVKAQADREELELARARGELIPVEMYQERMAGHIVAAKQRILALPSRISHQLEGENRNVIKQKLDTALRGALTALAKDDHAAAD